MGEVVDPDDVILADAQLPHLLVPGEVVLIFNRGVVLLHGLLESVVALPDLAVAVVEDRVVPGLREDLVR